LLAELAHITGGTDISRGEFSSVSGVALEIMVTQDQLRIRRALQSGQNARAAVAGLVLKTLKNHATQARLDKLAKGRVVEVFSWNRNDITSTDVEIYKGEQNGN